jgi:hypothetical protein
MADLPGSVVPLRFASAGAALRNKGDFAQQEQAATSDPPEVSNLVPSEGATILRDQALQFDVTDDGGAFSALLVVAVFDTARPIELIHDGTRFSFPYTASSRTAITNGFRYLVRRTGGWPASPTFTVHAVDTGGANA